MLRFINLLFKLYEAKHLYFTISMFLLYVLSLLKVVSQMTIISYLEWKITQNNKMCFTSF